MSAKAEAKAEVKMSPEELKKALEEKAKAPHKEIKEHDSPAVIQARTQAAITSGKIKLEHHEGRPKGEGLTEAAKQAYLEDKKEKEGAKAEAPKA